MTPQEYLEKIRPLRNPEEIEKVCTELTTFLFNETDKPKTRINKLTPYNKLIKEISNDELIEDENAFIQTKQNGSLWKRHLHFKFTGIADAQWYGDEGINTTTRVTNRLQNKQEVGVKEYLETTLKLLNSDDPHELAVGLIAASGRRPIEILVRGSFEIEEKLPAYLKKGYFVKFSGQAKKRDYSAEERSEYRIGLLVPATTFLGHFKRFREMPETVELLDYLASETEKGVEPEIINGNIEDRRGNSLRRVVTREFSFLPLRHGDTEINNKTLRAVYVCLVTDRDCPRNIVSLLWAGRAVGHFIDTKKPDDSQLKNLLTTLGYFDYYPDSVVTFPGMQNQSDNQKLGKVSAFKSDIETLRKLQVEWQLPNQQSVIARLIELSLQAKSLDEKVIDAQSKCETENTTEMKDMNGKEDLKTMVKDLVTESLRELLPQFQQATPKPSIESNIEAENLTKTLNKQTVSETDIEEMSSEELRKSKVRGVADEKIRRSFLAICEYNDKQTENNLRWFVGNQTLRQLSGSNGQLISDWIGRHKLLVEDHNNKYGLGMYHNKRHKQQISEVVSW